MHGTAAVARLVLVVLLSAACVPVSAPPVPSSSCTGIPRGACDELVATLSAGVPGEIAAISLTCRIAVCTRAGGGAGDAVITFADGRSQLRTWTYPGDPNPLPDPVCIGLARIVCLALIRNIADETPISKRILAVTITCTAQCQEASGDVTTLVTYADGTQASGQRSWSGGMP